MRIFLFLISISCWAADTTPTGIPLNSSWRKQVYEYAQKNVVHPSWGIAHSERNFQVARNLANKEGFTLDEDVLFVAAFLHDIGGLDGFAKDEVDHAVRSVEVIEPLLPQWGFPAAKWTAVKEMILGHVYYGPVPASQSAQAFRDADILDFLGTIGVARMIAVTQEKGFANGTLKPTVDVLRNFAKTMTSKCSLKASQTMAGTRESETQAFLDNLDFQTFGGAAL